MQKISVADFELLATQIDSDIDTLDTDNDGLSNYVESVLGTDSENADSDEDGYDDKTEILAGYNPVSASARLLIDKKFVKQQNGRIIFQSSVNALWYVSPKNRKRYLIKGESSISHSR